MPEAKDLSVGKPYALFGKYMYEDCFWGQEGWLASILIPPCQIIPFSRLPENFPGESYVAVYVVRHTLQGVEHARLPL